MIYILHMFRSMITFALCCMMDKALMGIRDILNIRGLRLGNYPNVGPNLTISSSQAPNFGNAPIKGFTLHYLTQDMLNLDSTTLIQSQHQVFAMSYKQHPKKKQNWGFYEFWQVPWFVVRTQGFIFRLLSPRPKLTPFW